MSVTIGVLIVLIMMMAETTYSAKVHVTFEDSEVELPDSWNRRYANYFDDDDDLPF